MSTTSSQNTIDECSQRALYVASDYVLLNVGWLLFTVVRYASLTSAFTAQYSFADHITSTPVVLGQVLIPLMTLILYWISGYYNYVFFKSRLDELVNTASVTAVSVIITFFAVLFNDGVPERLRNLEMMAIMWALMFTPVYIGRLCITIRAAARIHRREIAYNTLIVGTGRAAVTLANKLMRAHRGNGFRVVGFVETNQARNVRPDIDNYPVYSMDNLQEVLTEHDITRLVVVPHNGGMRHTGELINSLLQYGCSLFVTPDLYSLIVARPRIGDIAGEPLVDITSGTTTPFTLNCKRLADITISALTLVFLSPLYLALAIAVKRDSKGPVLYRQERIGYRKKPFYIYKFRSMYTDAEASGPALSSLNDPRITRIGHFLRKYRLDELPQFYNVLRGDMSLVGPRPEREYYIQRIVARAPYYTLMHRVRPGITSWGMVKYGYAVSVDQMIERLHYDLIYLENVSLIVDLKILFYTVNTVITGRGL